MALPQKLPIDLMQTAWASQINPVLNFAPNQGVLVKNIALINGVTVVKHKLSRMMQGWIIIDQDAPATIYPSHPLNNLTITLTSNMACNISLWCF